MVCCLDFDIETILYPIEVFVPLFGHFDRRLPKAIPHVIQSGSVLLMEYPVGDVVPERVRRHVARAIAVAFDCLRADISVFGQGANDTADALGGHAVALPAREERSGVLLAVVQIRLTMKP